MDPDLFGRHRHWREYRRGFRRQRGCKDGNMLQHRRRSYLRGVRNESDDNPERNTSYRDVHRFAKRGYVLTNSSLNGRILARRSCDSLIGYGRDNLDFRHTAGRERPDLRRNSC
jgi:hypothetical protein